MGNCCPKGNVNSERSSVANVLVEEVEQTKMKATQPMQTSPNLASTSNALTVQKPKGQVNREDFIKIDKLGYGAFGVVYKVRQKKTNKIYAMKQIEKERIFKNKLQNNTVLERNVLKQSKHPFIVRLKYAFQTNSHIYFIMEYIAGGEFYRILGQVKTGLPENVVKFVAAEVVLALEYLNTKLKVIYRDLKPENLLLTTTGHVKLTDFGLATMRRENGEKSYTVAGTAEYLAPEIVNKSGHSYEVDIWTLGIMIYEMINGFTPFRDSNNDFKMISQNIIENRPVYPEKMSSQSVDLIKQILQTNPSERLGVKGDGYAELKRHPFFNGIIWDQLSNLKVTSPLKTFAERNTQKMDKQPQNFQNTPCNPQSPKLKIDGITFEGEGGTLSSYF
ncbi:unnamed protein product (macronuclear) [Paramecium tetraurelia]|uniref:non-specific serine/threonine protein kinase n=1 Tax=Paramecium tetraurelia TaxID=5888 RepID=A0CX71_PARTE|nr:uncharacterized protein GSPATT00001592001 [Paramecium tetraurelia]CAK75388.1 unnamed protein product [Paramecium tetraurelia]|eukprot:XP_001442785.1 hypothetical protein (macronuclear) [Paramecium tetraurelia strain d4-2]